MKKKGLLAMAVVAALMLGMVWACAAETALTLEDALAAALARARLDAADVFVTQLSEDEEDGRRVFEVEFIAGGKEYEFDVDASTGEVIKESTETASGRKGDMEVRLYLAMDAAKEKALSEASVTPGDAVFTEIEFDFDDGRAEYELTFTAGGQTYQVELDAQTGQVLKYEMWSGSGKK